MAPMATPLLFEELVPAGSLSQRSPVYPSLHLHVYLPSNAALLLRCASLGSPWLPHCTIATGIESISTRCCRLLITYSRMQWVLSGFRQKIGFSNPTKPKNLGGLTPSSKMSASWREPSNVAGPLLCVIVTVTCRYDSRFRDSEPDQAQSHTWTSNSFGALDYPPFLGAPT
jgi:hypothetical protein